MSEFFSKRKLTPGKGRKGYDPEEIFRYLAMNSDKDGYLVYTLNELAEAVSLDRDVLKKFIWAFKDIGLMDTLQAQWIRVKVDPDSVEWTDEFIREFVSAKSRYDNKKKEKK